jgi:serine/threonine-protein kinase PRP4
MQELKGKFPKSMIRHSILPVPHFENLDFIQTDIDKISGKPVVKRRVFQGPETDLRRKLGGGDELGVDMFCNFIDKCLVLNPERRMTVQEGLLHPFLTTKFS